MNKATSITLVFICLFGLGFAQTLPETNQYISAKDGQWNSLSSWTALASANEPITCNPTGSTIFRISDSIATNCDKLKLSGDVLIIIESGGSLSLKGNLELIGKARLQVNKGGNLFVGRNLVISGNAKVEHDGKLVAYGDVVVSGSAFVCGKGSASVGGAVSGMGWCLDLGVLPLEVLSIDAKLSVSDVITLSWTSDIASTSDYFTVERSSNGMSFKAIGEVSAANAQNIYTYTDISLSPGTYYYRIIQKDQSGQKEAESVIAATVVENKSTGVCELLVDPNPCIPSCLITLEDCPGAVFRTYVMDGAGRMISELVPVNTQNKDAKIQYYLNKDNFMSPGIYIIRAQSETSDVSKKLIIK